jgi:hypothetical protein
MNEKLTHYQINKNWLNPLLAKLAYEKYQAQSFGLK